jgi:hypothetical protein
MKEDTRIENRTATGVEYENKQQGTGAKGAAVGGVAGGIAGGAVGAGVMYASQASAKDAEPEAEAQEQAQQETATAEAQASEQQTAQGTSNTGEHIVVEHHVYNHEAPTSAQQTAQAHSGANNYTAAQQQTDDDVHIIERGTVDGHQAAMVDIDDDYNADAVVVDYDDDGTADVAYIDANKNHEWDSQDVVMDLHTGANATFGEVAAMQQQQQQYNASDDYQAEDPSLANASYESDPMDDNDGGYDYDGPVEA